MCCNYLPTINDYPRTIYRVSKMCCNYLPTINDYLPFLPFIYRWYTRYTRQPRNVSTKIAKETRGVLTFPPRAPAESPRPACVARVCCPLRSVFVPQNVSKFQRAAVMDCCEPREHMTARQTPSREVLRTRTNCPGCDKVITYHALAYKHKCPRVPNTWEGKKQRQLAALHARINARIPASEPQAIPEPAVA